MDEDDSPLVLRRRALRQLTSNGPLNPYRKPEAIINERGSIEVAEVQERHDEVSPQDLVWGTNGYENSSMVLKDIRTREKSKTDPEQGEDKIKLSRDVLRTLTQLPPTT